MEMQAVTANRLDDGFVVYLTPAGDWSARLDDAALAGAAEAEALLAAAAGRTGEVVGPYLIRLAIEDGAPRPLGQRERLRTLGPSVRPDLGYQAERS